MMLRKKLW